MTTRIGMKRCECSCRCDKQISARSTRSSDQCDYCYNGIHRQPEWRKRLTDRDETGQVKI